VASVLAGRPELTLSDELPAAPRVGLFRTPPFDVADPATIAALDYAVARIEASGGKVVEIEVPANFVSTHDLHAAVMGWEVTRALSYERTVLWEQLTQTTRDFLNEKALVDAPAYDKARAALPAVYEALAEAMANVDILLAPSAPGAAPKGLISTGSPAFNTPWTLLQMPALNVPAYFENGLPVGVQVIGRRGEDARTLAAARFVEAAVGVVKEPV
jgi:amidase